MFHERTAREPLLSILKLVGLRPRKARTASTSITGRIGFRVRTHDMQRHCSLNLPRETTIYIVELHRILFLAVFLVKTLPVQPSFRVN
jgi:hypothetical protein